MSFFLNPSLNPNIMLSWSFEASNFWLAIVDEYLKLGCFLVPRLEFIVIMEEVLVEGSETATMDDAAEMMREFIETHSSEEMYTAGKSLTDAKADQNVPLEATVLVQLSFIQATLSQEVTKMANE